MENTLFIMIKRLLHLYITNDRLYLLQCRHEVESETSKIKCGRPSKNTERRKNNEATMRFKLIDLWANHECLNNTKSSAYLNKDNWSHALDRIVQAFHNTEKPPTKDQVQLNFTRFRNYYGGKNNKVEKSKTSGGDLDSVYVPRWKFFDSLQFLKHNLVACTTKSNLEDDDSLLRKSSICNSDNPPSAKSVRKIWKGQKSNAQVVMATATKALEKISSRCNGSLEKKNKADENWNLVEMIYTMPQPIHDNMSKASNDTLRLELQQNIIQVKYRGYRAVPGSNVHVALHLHQAPQASANNYFEFMSPPSVPSSSGTLISSTPPASSFLSS